MGNQMVQATLTLLAASILIWSLLPLTPGDPAMRFLEAHGAGAPLPSEIKALRHEWGLDKPLPIQYIQWVKRALHGDLSGSFQSGKPVAGELAKRFPYTMMLAGTTVVISLFLSVIAALIASSHEGKWPDHLITFLTQIGTTTPSFLLGLLLLYFVVLNYNIGQILSKGQFSHVWLPSLCLSVHLAAGWTQILRASLLEVLNKNFTLVAKARGASPLRVLFRYALPNAFLPFLTAIGMGFGALLGGAPIIESIFSWPGMGSYAIEAIAARDMPVIQGFVMVSTVLYVVMSFGVDTISNLLDVRHNTKDHQ